MALFGFQLLVTDMKCSSCLSIFRVYATRRIANCVALAILMGTYQLVNDIRAAEVISVSVLAKLKRRRVRKVN